MTVAFMQSNQILQHVQAILEKKNKDYGDENLVKYGKLGIIVRISDKMSRLSNLLENAPEIREETFNDTLIDIVGYIIQYNRFKYPPLLYSIRKLIGIPPKNYDKYGRVSIQESITDIKHESSLLIKYGIDCDSKGEFTKSLFIKISEAFKRSELSRSHHKRMYYLIKMLILSLILLGKDMTCFS